MTDRDSHRVGRSIHQAHASGPRIRPSHQAHAFERCLLGNIRNQSSTSTSKQPKDGVFSRCFEWARIVSLALRSTQHRKIEVGITVDRYFGRSVGRHRPWGLFLYWCKQIFDLVWVSRMMIYHEWKLLDYSECPTVTNEALLLPNEWNRIEVRRDKTTNLSTNRSCFYAIRLPC